MALAAAFVLLPASHSLAQQPRAPAADPAAAAGDIADFFSQVGDQIYEDCIFELSQEQLEVQQSLIKAYIKQGAPSSLARQLAVKQIQPPTLSDKCRQIKGQAKAAPPSSGRAALRRKKPGGSYGLAQNPIRKAYVNSTSCRPESAAAVGLRAQRRLRHDLAQRL